MRLGGSVFYKGENPQEFAQKHLEKGFSACVCPKWVTIEKPQELEAFKQAMAQSDIRIAEVGTWCNPMHPDKAEAEKAFAWIVNRLATADALGAATCVNVLGTLQDISWYGPCTDGYSQKFFDQAVQTYQRVLDEVQPQNTTFSFEMMPYSYLDGPEAYLDFLKAVDRPHTGVHLDICNAINQPVRYFDTTAFIRHTFDLLREKIVSLHLKDIALRVDALTVQFDEVLLGTGNIDYVTLMEEIAKLPADTPAMLEHLKTEELYDRAAQAAIDFAQKAGMRKVGPHWVRG